MSEEPRAIAIIGGVPVEIIAPVFHSSMLEGCGKTEFIMGSLPREISCTVVIGGDKRDSLKALADEYHSRMEAMKKPERHPFKVNANTKTKGTHVYPFYQKGW